MNPRRATPSMSWLLAFEATARHLSFTRAAEELALTQSVISRHVSALENLLGVALFRREARQIILTDTGATYLVEIQGALQCIRNASLQASAHGAEGAVHLASLPTFAARWLMPRLLTFYTAHPGILVHVHSRIGPADVALAGMDAAICVGDGLWPGLASHFLLEDVLVPVMSPVLARAIPVVQATDLLSHKLLQVTARGDAWPRWFAAQGVAGKAMQMGPKFEVTAHLIQSVVAGMGVGLVPTALIENELRSGTLVMPLVKPLETGLAYYLIEPPRRTPTPALTILKEWLLGVA
jgi:DNA-binding transcriptional LysR family regulator